MRFVSFSIASRINKLCDALHLSSRQLMLMTGMMLFMHMQITPSELFAQKAVRPKEPNRGEIQNFHLMQKDWNGYFDALKQEKLEANPNNPNPLKGTGWKQYKRWEWYWQSRVNPDGTFPDFDKIDVERQRVQKTPPTITQAPQAQWVEWGPTKARGGYWGVGRINSVVVTNGTMYAATAGSGLWRSSDNGITWTNPTRSFSGLGTSDIAFENNAASSNMVMYLATGDYLGNSPSGVPSIGVFKSLNGGTTWTPTGLTFLRNEQVLISRILVSPTNNRIVHAASNRGIHRSTDGGTTWTLATLDPDLRGNEKFMDMEMKFGDPSVMLASTNFGRIYRSSDGGQNWERVTSTLPSDPATTGRAAIAVARNEPNTMYILFTHLSNRGFLAFYKSTDAGATWTAITVSPANIFGYANLGDDAGGQGSYDLALAVSSTNANVVYSGTVNLWMTSNGGANWTNVGHWSAASQTPRNSVQEVHADHHFLFVPTGSETVYVANDGGIYSSSNSGASWNWHVNGTTGINMMQLYRLAVSQTDPNRTLIGAQDNSTTLLNGADVIERTQATGDGMGQLIDRTNVQNMFTSGTNGKLQQSVDGGESWSSYFPEESRNSEKGAWVTPYIQSNTSATTMFFGYVNVYRGDNAMSENPVFTRISNFGADNDPLQTLAIGANGLALYASTGQESVRYSPNGGATWFTRALPEGVAQLTKIATHPTNPNVIWVTFGGYNNLKVFRSDNAGETWINISGSLPSVPANVVIAQRNSPDRIYVGTDVGVYYRDSTMSDWQKYNDGAMSDDNIVVTDLDIQYSQQQLRAATYSRGLMSGRLITNSAPPPTLVGQLSINPASLSFGSVTQGAATTTTASMTVSGVNFSANQVLTPATNTAGISFSPQTIQANATGTIAATPITATWSVPTSLAVGTINGAISWTGTTATVPFRLNVIATVSPVQVSGRIADGAGVGASGVQVSAVAQGGSTPAAVSTTDQQGLFTLQLLPAVYTITPTRSASVFTPLSRDITVGTSPIPDMNFVVAPTTSIGHPLVGENIFLRISPNPASDIVSIQWQSTIAQHYTITITNLLGGEVYSTSGVSMTERQSVQWSAQVPNGVYFVRVTTLAGQNIAKVIVAR